MRGESVRKRNQERVKTETKRVCVCMCVCVQSACQLFILRSDWCPVWSDSIVVRIQAMKENYNDTGVLCCSVHRKRMLNVTSSTSLSCILFKTVSYNAARAGIISGQVEAYLKSLESNAVQVLLQVLQCGTSAILHCCFWIYALQFISIITYI